MAMFLCADVAEITFSTVFKDECIHVNSTLTIASGNAASALWIGTHDRSQTEYICPMLRRCVVTQI